MATSDDNPFLAASAAKPAGHSMDPKASEVSTLQPHMPLSVKLAVGCLSIFTLMAAFVVFAVCSWGFWDGIGYIIALVLWVWMICLLATRRYFAKLLAQVLCGIGGFLGVGVWYLVMVIGSVFVKAMPSGDIQMLARIQNIALAIAFLLPVALLWSVVILLATPSARKFFRAANNK